MPPRYACRKFCKNYNTKKCESAWSDYGDDYDVVCNFYEKKEEQDPEVDLDGKTVDPQYHDCKYKGNPDWEYKACAMCIYRFTCKYIRYNLPNPLKEVEIEK